MSKGSAPATVDPYQAAAAQYQYGTAAANYNTGLNNVNTVTPYGETYWTQDPSGEPSTSGGGLGGPAPQQAGGGTNYGGPPQNGAGEVPLPNYPAVQSTTQGAAPSAQYPKGVPAGAQSPPGYDFYGSLGINGPASAYGTPGSTQPASGGNELQTNAAGSKFIPQATPPQYTQHQILSPIEQQIFGATTGNQLSQASDYSNLLKQVPGSTPQLQTQIPGTADLPGEYDKGFNTALQGNLAAITPQLSAQYESLDSSLRNSGNLPGSPAYDTAMSQFMAGEGNELTQAGGAAVNSGLNVENTLFGQAATGAGFTNNALTTQYGLPFQGIEALGGSAGGTGTGSPTSFSMPGAQGAGASVQTPNIMDAFTQAYNQQLNGYNANVATSNATASDLAGLAGAALIAFA